ncbi:MAG TPA: alkaline phosphatase family protein [Pseudonocardiaceae bacterium]|jgi:phospholipase C|nr:alkaline phosphatase family protein [Pseudonocardiaceae bacterium]
MTRLSRRKLLTGAASLGGMTAAGMVLPPNLRKAMAATPPRSFNPREIKHVVLLMQENRSFDHYFGTLPGVRGFADPTAMKLASTGESIFYQPYSGNPDGYLLPFHLDTRSTGAQAIPSTDHGWATQHQALDAGKMDLWLPAKGPWTMGYYQRQDIPFHWSLAENFTIFDNYHCSVLGPTTPNRNMWMTGTIDPNGEAGGPILDTANFTGSWPTYAEALTDAGVSWKVYADDGFDNVLVYFENFQKADPDSVLYRSGVVGQPTGKFEFDCLTGNLPAVSWLCAPEIYDEHPSFWPANGAAWIAAKLDAIAANRELWESTVFILNYDENDGLFDHVVPPTPPAGTADEFVTKVSPVGTPGDGLPVGLGFRVPCIVVSPWTQGGWVCSDVSDHTSTLKFLEVVTGVPSPNISSWRRTTVGDLTGAFVGPRYDATPPFLPDTNGEVMLANYTTTLPLPAFPTTNQTRPVQLPGFRRHTR